MALVSDCEDCGGAGVAPGSTGTPYRNQIADIICHRCQGVGKISTEYVVNEPVLVLGGNIEIGAALTLVRSMGYHEGFENGLRIESMCRPVTDPENSDAE